MTMFKSYVPYSMYAMTIWDVYFKVRKVDNMSVSMNKLSFYTDVNPL